MRKTYTAYIGTYTYGESQGIYQLSLDTEKEQLMDLNLVAAIEHPPYLNITKDNRFLYAIKKEQDKGGVAAYGLHAPSELTYLNDCLLEGPPPCHLTTDSTGTYLFAASYDAGTVTSYQLLKNGHIDKVLSLIHHTGSGPNKERQENPHIHYVTLTPDEKFLCVVDLGIDQVVIYKINQGYLEFFSKVDFPAGSGPRHMTWHHDGNHAYVLTELSAEVMVLDYHEGRFEIVKIHPVLPPDFTGHNQASAIHFSPDGNHLYTSNRGHDSLAIFKVDPMSGALTFIDHVFTEGEIPRDFQIDPSGEFMLIAHQTSSNILLFKINKDTGYLSRTPVTISIPNPVCIKFLD